MGLHPFRLRNPGVGGRWKISNSSVRTRSIALAATFTALYVASNAIPISAFIGGAGFITAGIILLPVLARLLKPREAILVGILAPLGLFAFQLSLIPVFGFFGMLIPATALIFGSLGFHRSYLIPTAYAVFGLAWYVLFSGGTFLWLLPYFILIAFALMNQVRHFTKGGKWDILLHGLATTMCELVTMNIASISILHLSGGLWSLITPVMYFERSIAVAGSGIILLSLMRVKSILKMGYI